MCGLLVAFYLGAVGIYGAQLRREGIRDAEERARTLSRLLVQELGEELPLASVLAHPDQPKYFEILDRGVRDHEKLLDLAGVEFLDRRGVPVYPGPSGFRWAGKPDGVALRSALEGAIASGVRSLERPTEGTGTSIPTRLVETLVPLRDRAGRVTYVCRTLEDFTAEQGEIYRGVLAAAGYLALLTGLAVAALGALQRRVRRLQGEVDALERFLPICGHCKKVRVEAPGLPDRWVPVEAYFTETERIAFSHGICGECLETHHPEVTVGA